MLLLNLVQRCREQATDLPGSNNVNWQVDDEDLILSNLEWTALLNESENEYCLRRPIRDASSALTSLTLTGGGTGKVSLDPRVLYVDRVQVDGQTTPLFKRDTPWCDSHYSDWRSKTGDPHSYIDDEDDNEIHCWPVPASDATLHLNIRRFPLTPLDWDDRATQSPEIPYQDHEALIHWALGNAYLKDDELLYNKRKSNNHFALFRALVGSRPNPRSVSVQRFVSNRKPRVKGYYR